MMENGYTKEEMKMLNERRTTKRCKQPQRQRTTNIQKLEKEMQTSEGFISVDGSFPGRSVKMLKRKRGKKEK